MLSTYYMNVVTVKNNLPQFNNNKGTVQSRTQSPLSPPSAVGRRQVELWGNGIVHPRNLG